MWSMTRAMIPFVGRTRELRRLRGWLDAGRNVVLTGAFGSGRTALVRQLATQLSASYCFKFLDPTVTRAELRRLMQPSTTGVDPRRLLLVMDDVLRLTHQRLARWRELTRSGVHMIVIVDRSVPRESLATIRAAIGAAPLLSLGPLSIAASERYFAQCSSAFGLGWETNDVRGTARSTRGIPLSMRMTLDAAIRRAHRQ